MRLEDAEYHCYICRYDNSKRETATTVLASRETGKWIYATTCDLHLEDAMYDLPYQIVQCVEPWQKAPA